MKFSLVKLKIRKLENLPIKTLNLSLNLVDQLPSFELQPKTKKKKQSFFLIIVKFLVMMASDFM